MGILTAWASSLANNYRCVKSMDDIQGLLDEIENELHQELEGTEVSRDKAQQAVERSLTISTPVRRFYERYRESNDEK